MVRTWVFVLVLLLLVGPVAEAKRSKRRRKGKSKAKGKATFRESKQKVSMQATSEVVDSELREKSRHKMVAQFWMSKFDRDGDSVLNLSEVDTLVEEQLGGSNERKGKSYSRSIFNRIDKDEDEKCTVSELEAFQASMQKEAPKVEAMKHIAHQRQQDEAAAKIKGEL